MAAGPSSFPRNAKAASPQRSDSAPWRDAEIRDTLEGDTALAQENQRRTILNLMHFNLFPSISIISYHINGHGKIAKIGKPDATQTVVL